MVDLSSNFSNSTDNYQGTYFTNKHSMKMILVQLIEKSIDSNLSEHEHELIEVMNMFVCKCGLLEHQLTIVEQ
jgi:hypothetical protein